MPYAVIKYADLVQPGHGSWVEMAGGSPVAYATREEAEKALLRICEEKGIPEGWDAWSYAQMRVEAVNPNHCLHIAD